MPANSPLAAVLFLLLLLVGALLPASPVAAAGGSFGDLATTAMWQRRRLEEEVAPEFPSAATSGQPSGIGYGTFNPNQQSCISNCAAKAQGAAYTRPCTFSQQCPQGHP